MAAEDDADVLAEQVDYYRARADEYDDWFWRRGRYDRGPAATARWFSQVDEVRRALATVPLDGADVLEIAPGTGIWTAELVRRASHVTAVDTSDEMLARNRDRLGRDAAKVSYVTSDIFEWRTGSSFDAVVFCFWISHVPARRLGAFLGQVASLARPGGAVFFLDAKREASSTASDHALPAEGVETMTRRLDDGREFTIVKNFWGAVELEEYCARAGLRVEVRETSDYFQYGIGSAGPVSADRV